MQKNCEMPIKIDIPWNTDERNGCDNKRTGRDG